MINIPKNVSLIKTLRILDITSDMTSHRDKYVLTLLKKHPSKDVKQLCSKYINEPANSKDKKSLYDSITNETLKYERHVFPDNIGKFDAAVTRIGERFPLLGKECEKYFQTSHVNTKYNFYRIIICKKQAIILANNQQLLQAKKYEYTPTHHFKLVVRQEISNISSDDLNACMEYFDKHKSEFETRKDPVLYIPFREIARQVYDIVQAEKIIENIRFLWV